MKFNIRFYNLSDKYLHNTKLPHNLKAMPPSEFEMFISGGFMKLMVDGYSDSLHSYIKQIEVISKNVAADLGHLETDGVATVSNVDDFMDHVGWLIGPQMNINISPKPAINIAKKKLRSLEVGFDSILTRDTNLRDFIKRNFSKEFVALKKFYFARYGGTREMDEFLGRVYEKNPFIFRLAGMRTSTESPYSLETFNRFIRRKNTSRTKP